MSDDGRRDGLWLALLIPGVLAVAAWPLSVLAGEKLPLGDWAVPSQGSLMRALYLHGTVALIPGGFPLGWYWTGVLAVSLLATAAWYRRQGRAGRPGLPPGYLITGAALLAVTIALPLLGWRTPELVLNDRAEAWLLALWQQGTFALLAIAVTLGILARARRSRGLAVIIVIYTAAAGFAGLTEAQPGLALLAQPGANPAVLLPAIVLLVAGLGFLVVAAARHPLPPARPEAEAG